MKAFDTNSTPGIGIDTTRRNLLASGAGLAAGAGLALSTAAALAAEPAAGRSASSAAQSKVELDRLFAPPQRKIKKIALEEHFITQALAPYSANAEGGVLPKAMADFAKRLADFDGLRLEEMDRAGIDISVLSATTPGVQVEPNAAIAVRKAKEVNDFLAKVVQRHPTRYAGFAHLPMQDPAVAANELERAVKQLGFKGALINGHTNGEYLDDEKFFPVWERAESLGVPIYLHPADPQVQPGVLKGYIELMGPMWGWQTETSSHVMRLIVGGVFDRFPKVTVIIGHMGEGLPFDLWRLDSRYGIVPHTKRLAKQPSQYIRENIIITTSGVDSAAPLLCSIMALGSDRILFSVDYPYESSQEAADFINNAPISEADRELICFRNASRILKIA